MSIDNGTVLLAYNGNGVTTAFAVPGNTNSFSTGEYTSEIKVAEFSALGVRTNKVLTTDYTLAGGPPATTVNMLVAPATGTFLVVYRDSILTQGTDFLGTGAFNSEACERALDKLTRLIQEAKYDIRRAPKWPLHKTTLLDEDMPAPSAGYALVWNTAGDGFDWAPMSAADISASVAAAAASATSAGNSATSATASAVAGAASAAAAVISAAAAAASAAAAAGLVSDTAFATSWNGVTTFAPSKNSVYDRFNTFNDFELGTWTVRSTPVAAPTYSSVVFSDELSLFCAVANTNTTTSLATSPDGTTWTERTLPVASGSLNAVIWVRDLNLFVAVGGKCFTSPDGVTWTERASLAGLGGSWLGITWSQKLRLLCACGTAAADIIATSPDGTTWTLRSTAGNLTLPQSICWSPELSIFVCVGATGTVRIVTSPDGITWTDRTAAAVIQLSSVVWVADLTLFVAVSVNGSQRVQTSPDGITWTSRDAATNSDAWYEVRWSQELHLLMATGTLGVCMTSPDGITWTAKATANSTQHWYGLCWAAALNIWCAVAGNGSALGAMTISVAYSNNVMMYKTVLHATGSHIAAKVAGTYALGQGDPAAVSGTGTLYPLALIYIDKADFPTINGKAAKMRLKVHLAVNDVAPTGNFTFGLYPVTRPGTSGGAGLNIFTMGTVVSGSNGITFGAPGADASIEGVSGEFAIPAAGYYVIGMVTTATVAASSHLHMNARLQVRNV